MRCLVTGAAGFIGSHLCERLLADGHKVIGLDNLSTGRLSNLRICEDNENFVFFARNIIDSHLDQLVATCDWVFHLAAKADLVPSIEQPLEYFHANVTSTLHLLEASRKAKVKNFIFASSSSVYGDKPYVPTSEFSNLNPVHPYALTKHEAEFLVASWGLMHQLPFTVLRLFNVYGPRHRTNGAYGGVFGTFMAQLANGKPVTIVGDGAQERDFVHVRDVCDAFVRAAKVPHGMAINIGSGFSHTVNELAKLLDAQEFEYVPSRPKEPKYICADISRARDVLGWRPKVTFIEGVTELKGMIPQYKDAPIWNGESIGKATKSWFDHLGGQE